MAILDTISKKIKALRQSRGITQEEFAFRLGISLPAYSKIERGITDISVTRLEQISGQLGVKIPLFFSEDGYEEKLTTLEGPNMGEQYLINAIKDKEQIISLQKRYIEQLERKS